MRAGSATMLRPRKGCVAALCPSRPSTTVPLHEALTKTSSAGYHALGAGRPEDIE